MRPVATLASRIFAITRKSKSNTFPRHSLAGAAAGEEGESGYLVDVFARCLCTAQEGVREISDGERAAVSLRDVGRCIKASHAVLRALFSFLQYSRFFSVPRAGSLYGVLENIPAPPPTFGDDCNSCLPYANERLYFDGSGRIPIAHRNPDSSKSTTVYRYTASHPKQWKHAVLSQTIRYNAYVAL